MDSTPLKDKVAALTTEQAALKQALAQAAPVAHGFQEGGTPKTPYEGFHDARVHVRGRYDRLADLVPRHFPTIVAGDQQPAISQGSGRMQLAQWIASADNPLTARVMVNRVWLHHFGQGLVRTPSDFGTRGEPPTHPELLDYLATELIQSKWSLKHIHRLIVTSATYRQSSNVRPELKDTDPNNKLYARQSRIRLDAEIVRDVALASSGLLSEKIGGPSVYPPIPDGVMGVGQVKHTWRTSKGEDRYRRGLYTFTFRASMHPSLATFDAPDAITACTRRIRSNTPLQALNLLNDSAWMEFSRSLAQRVLNQTLDRRPGRLALPADVVRAVVGESQFVGAHSSGFWLRTSNLP